MTINYNNEKQQCTTMKNQVCNNNAHWQQASKKFNKKSPKIIINQNVIKQMKTLYRKIIIIMI
jgi:hypothetical protein